ncbi:MAG TPA: gas vesicle protein GvpG [Armatimonadota bacterium]|nr:gas vesicle protein GvpG [Armatimonadota bacterium]
MPLLKLLAGLPLAPVKGMVTLARQLQQQAEREKEAELLQVQAELLELELCSGRGEMREEDLVEKEAELLQKLGALAGVGAAGDRQ